ncbi:nli interacting factor-like phosphatase family protein [Stylonychia lemnae]|uniref:Mitochondrial import inner membrane translocase subunit TIM50 n=1 Tax=Stylonychia lemnae TaxID=5949 RepID=A0A078B0W5_STYLE|nr:nli interacting factor-like phosphatase family protein [Stylonychia lemnae]|eukprot:CDW88199.1 nli interacting factor-like phosphatase family protein [Stylonychia lemnae]
MIQKQTTNIESTAMEGSAKNNINNDGFKKKCTGDDPFGFGDDGDLFGELDKQCKPLLRKGTQMPQFKEISLDFIDEDKIKELSPSKKGYRKFSTFLQGEKQFNFNSHYLRAQEFEIVKEVDELSSQKKIFDKKIEESNISQDLYSNINLNKKKKHSDNSILHKLAQKTFQNEIFDPVENSRIQHVQNTANNIPEENSLLKPIKNRGSFRRKTVRQNQSELQMPGMLGIQKLKSKSRSKNRKRNSSQFKKNKLNPDNIKNKQYDESDLLKLKKCESSVNFVEEKAQEQELPQLKLSKIHSEAPRRHNLIIEDNKVSNQDQKLQPKKQTTVFDKMKSRMPYNQILLSDLKYKDFYAESLYEAIFTFPKFQRTLSKNYKNVQMSYRKVTKKKKTIVFDIDETLVLATTNPKELKSIDDQIFIKMTRFGGSARAYLSFRPYLHDMLDELSKDFELILYTCGTASYAQVFAEAVQKKRKYFNHILSLTHCLYSMENEMFIKDLKILEEGRSLKDIVIVDNNIQSFFLQLSNGIPIYDYTGDKNDEVLLSLTEYLKQFLHVDDVRQKIDKDFRIKELLEEKADHYMSN